MCIDGKYKINSLRFTNVAYIVLWCSVARSLLIKIKVIC